MTRTIIDLIGNTPLVEVKNFDTGPCRLFLKLESQNPGGSIKDRIGLSMVEDAEKKGIQFNWAAAGTWFLMLALALIVNFYFKVELYFLPAPVWIASLGIYLLFSKFYQKPMAT